MSWEVRQGDALALLREMPEASVDAIVTDPPYGLSFMGKGWDHGIPGEPYWSAALRVAKPGAHLLAFGGTRTFHRLTCAIEDAGFEIRDCLMWLYGSGFPKSLDVSKAIDKHLGAARPRDVVPQPRSKLHGDRPWMNDPAHRFESKEPITAAAAAAALQGLGTALKPAWEPIILARKPLAGTVAANVLEHGTGALAIDPCRIGTETLPAATRGVSRLGTFEDADGNVTPECTGRWPANVLLDEDAAEILDEQSGELTSGFMAAGTQREGIGYRGGLGTRVARDTHADSGGASRFFFVSKGDECEGASDAEPSSGPRSGRGDSVPSDAPTASGQTDPRGIAGRGSTGSSASSTRRRSRAPSAESPEDIATIPTTPNYCESCGSVLHATDAPTRADDAERAAVVNVLVSGTRFLYTAKSSSGERHYAGKNSHPTVKPVDLMRWLCRLVTPKGGLVLDPFMGSGSTGVAALSEGLRFLGFDNDPESVAIARKRIAGPLFA